MQLYKNFFKMIRAHRGPIIIYLAVMVIYAVSMIFSAPHTLGQNEEISTERNVGYSNLGVTLRDNDHSELSEGLKSYLEKYGTVEMDEDSSEESINDLLYFHLTDFFIEIPEGFQEAVETGKEPELTYSSNSQVSGKTFSFVNDVDAFINIYRSYRAMGLSADDSVAKALETSVSEVTFGIVAEEVEVKDTNPTEYALYMVLMYFCYTCLALMLTAVGAVVIESNKHEVSSRIDVSPVRPALRTMANFGGMMTCAVVIILAMVIFAFAYGGSTTIMSKYAWVVILNLITTTFYICALSLLVCCFRPKANALNLISNSVGLSMCFVCGIFVPFEILGSSVQTLAHFLPFFWSGKVLNTIYSGSGMNYTYSVGSIFSDLGVQILFGIVFLLLAIIVRKSRRLESKS